MKGDCMAKKGKKGKSHIVAYFTVFAVVMTLVLISWNGGRALQKKINEYERQEARYQELIQNEEQRALDLEEKKKYIQTKQYIEQIAKERFGLIYKNEIVFKPNRD